MYSFLSQWLILLALHTGPSRLLYKCPVLVNTTHTIHHIHFHCLFLLIVLLLKEIKFYNKSGY